MTATGTGFKSGGWDSNPRYIRASPVPSGPDRPTEAVGSPQERLGVRGEVVVGGVWAGLQAGQDGADAGPVPDSGGGFWPSRVQAVTPEPTTNPVVPEEADGEIRSGPPLRPAVAQHHAR